MRKKGQKLTKNDQRTNDASVRIPVHVFADHRQIKSLDSLMAAHQDALSGSCLKGLEPTPKPKVSSLSFPSMGAVRQSIGDSMVDACASKRGFGLNGVGEAIQQKDLERLLPRIWVRSATGGREGECPAIHRMLNLPMNSALRLHTLRHAYAHAGGWDALHADDRCRVAYVVRGRLQSPDRIRFSHAESCAHEADRVQEYWAELLAFAFGIPAQNQSEWRRLFLARSVQRAAGAPLAYPMRETGLKDRDLVEWHLKRTNVAEPWEFANRSVEWVDRVAREGRMDRIRHVASGFPPGKLRSVYSGLMHSEPTAPDHARALKRAESSVPMHVVSWIERACLLADELATLEYAPPEEHREPLPLFSAAAELAGEWSRFSHEDQQRLLRALTQYMQELSV